MLGFTPHFIFNFPELLINKEEKEEQELLDTLFDLLDLPDILYILHMKYTCVICKPKRKCRVLTSACESGAGRSNQPKK